MSEAKPAPGVNVTRTAISGTAVSLPAGIVAVWFLNQFVLPDPMPSEIGFAVGSMVNAAVVWAVQWLPQRRGER